MIRIAILILLTAALWLGGSGQAAIGLLIIELGAVGLAVWSFASVPQNRLDEEQRQLLILVGALMLLAIAQLVPLPPSIWHALPGREAVEAGDQLLGIRPWRPISLTPEHSAATLAFLFVPAAIIVASIRNGHSLGRPVAMLIVATAVLQALWGLAQLSGQAPKLYAWSSNGPVGAFANTNHLAALAVSAVPMVGALVATFGRDSTRLPAWGIGLAILGLLAMTVFATGSTAMIALFVPAALFAGVIATGRKFERVGRVVAVLLMGGIGVGLLVATGSGLAGSSVSASSRATIWTNSLGLVSDMVAGGGLGSFQALYGAAEDPFAVTNFYVNHAHNDALQWAIEAGIPGVLLLLLFLLWWVRASLRVWQVEGDSDPIARAAAVSGLVLLAHSLVDFPLRMAALAALFAVTLALLAGSRPPEPVADANDLRPTRHRRVR